MAKQQSRTHPHPRRGWVGRAAVRLAVVGLVTAGLVGQALAAGGGVAPVPKGSSPARAAQVRGMVETGPGRWEVVASSGTLQVALPPGAGSVRLVLPQEGPVLLTPPDYEVRIVDVVKEGLVHEIVVPPGTPVAELRFEVVPGETEVPRVGPIVTAPQGKFRLQDEGSTATGTPAGGTGSEAGAGTSGGDGGTGPSGGSETDGIAAGGSAAAGTPTGDTASDAAGATATATGTVTAEATGDPVLDWVRFFGGGYGHRTGMSQRGAQGLGKLGVPYKDILAHYYPGTRLDQRKTPDAQQPVRVGLSLDEAGVQGSAPKPRLLWRVDVPAGSVLDGATKLSLPAGSYSVTYDGTAGFRWQLLDAAGKAAGEPIMIRGKKASASATTEKLDLVIPDGQVAQLHYPYTTCDVDSDHAFRGCRDYEGRLEFEAPKAVGSSNAGIVVRNKINLYQYLVGVVPHESPASWSEEALKAQSVAARTYAARQNFGLDQNLVDSTYDQVFYGRYNNKDYRPKIERVVQATDAQVLTDTQGDLITTYFTGGNGGYIASNTEAFGDGTDKPRDYLIGRKDRFVLRDGTAITPEFYKVNGVTYEDGYFRWRRDVPRSVIEKLWPEIGTLKSIEVVSRSDASMTPLRLRLTGSAGSVEVLARVFRSRVGLPSAFFLPDKLYPREFADVPPSLALARDINRAYQLGLVEGDLWARYEPDGLLTRSAFTKMIVEALERLRGGPLEQAEVSFTDVNASQAFYVYIKKAYHAGIIRGYADGTFGYDKPISRLEAAVILQRAFGFPAQEREPFRDVPDDSQFAGDIASVAAAGVMRGVSDTTFEPGGTMTRGMAAAVAIRSFDYCYGGQCRLAE